MALLALILLDLAKSLVLTLPAPSAEEHLPSGTN
jgi:hypothetical protein